MYRRYDPNLEPNILKRYTSENRELRNYRSISHVPRFLYLRIGDFCDCGWTMMMPTTWRTTLPPGVCRRTTKLRRSACTKTTPRTPSERSARRRDTPGTRCTTTSLQRVPEQRGHVRARRGYAHVNFVARPWGAGKERLFFAEVHRQLERDTMVPTCLRSLDSEDDRVGGIDDEPWEVRVRADGARYCFACHGAIKHPKDGACYRAGHRTDQLPLV
jgi:hypothetical protein